MDPTKKAINYIKICCKRIGAFSGSTDVLKFLKRVASEMAASQPSIIFPNRYIEHVAYAIDMVASNPFTSSPAAIASLYLVTRFEFYFRILSGKLNADGTWTTPKAKASAQAALRNYRLGKQRVSSVAIAYKIMKIDQSRMIAQHCAKLDNTLYSTPTTVVGRTKVCDIGDRIKFGRDAAGHGHWGDISSEAIFYGLMTAIVFYNQA